MARASSTEARGGAFEEQMCSIVHGPKGAALAEALGEGDVIMCVAAVDAQAMMAEAETSDSKHSAVGDGGLMQVEAALFVEVVRGPEPMLVGGSRPVWGGGVPRIAVVDPATVVAGAQRVHHFRGLEAAAVLNLLRVRAVPRPKTLEEGVKIRGPAGASLAPEVDVCVQDPGGQCRGRAGRGDGCVPEAADRCRPACRPGPVPSLSV